jgi:hypothetical protein
MAKPQLQAAEYLRSPRVSTTRSDGIVVEIEAGLLLKRADQSEWKAKVIRCAQSVMQDGWIARIRSADGVPIPVDPTRPLRSPGCARSHDPSDF